MEKTRIQHIDITRGIAIICIILGHLGNAHINSVVFTFHVPVFFFITGYFTNTNLCIKDFIKNKTRTLLVPYVFTSFLIILLGTLEYLVFVDKTASWQALTGWLYAAIYGAGDSYSSPFYIKAIGSLWFLWASFWSSIFLRCLLNTKKTAARIVIVLVLFIAGYWSRALFWFPLSIQAGCCATLFLYIGYLFHNSEDIFKKFPKELKTFITIFALLTWLSFIKNFQSFWLVHCDIGRGIIDIFGCICGCYIIILISLYIKKHIPIISKALSFLGKYSIFMLSIHSIELNTLPWWQLTQLLVKYGMPGYLQLYSVIFGKFTVIILGTIICANWNLPRKIFGISPYPIKSRQ